MPPFSNALRAAGLASVLCGLAGCSDYLARRDTIALQGGNAVMTDRVTQMIDPWPPESGDRDFAYNGLVVEGAMERYRTGRVIAPSGNGTSAAYQTSQNNSATGPQNNQPTAPVK